MRPKGSARSRTFRAPPTTTSAASAPAPWDAGFLRSLRSSGPYILRSLHPQILTSSDPYILRFSAFDVQVFFAQVHSQRAPAQHGDVLDAAAHADALAGGRHAQVLREHGHLAGTIVDLIEAKRHQRHAPRARHHAAHADGAIVIAARVAL